MTLSRDAIHELTDRVAEAFFLSDFYGEFPQVRLAPQKQKGPAGMRLV